MNIVPLQPRTDKLELIYSRYDDWDIFRYYFGDFKTGKRYSSPFRKDENPSFSFYISDSSTPKAHDFSTGENYNGIKFVQELYGLSFPETLDKICSDFGLLEIDFKAEIYKVTQEEKQRIIVESRPKQIKAMIQPFSEQDLLYWRNHGIEKEETLKFLDIYSTKKFWINKQAMRVQRPSYVYLFKKSNHLKIYQPKSKNKFEKWFSNTNNLEDVQGYWQMDIKKTKPELLVLTSSMKEIAFLWERGLYAMAGHNESCNFEPDFIRHLKKYCKRIVSLYDFDEAGIKGGQKLWEQYQIEPIEKPSYMTCPQKDITDYYKYGNRTELNQFINEIKTMK